MDPYLAVQDKINKFLSETRSENTRRIAKEIVTFLIEMRKFESQSKPGVWKYGWTRSSVIFKEFSIEHPRTITRMLENLHKSGIIEYRKCDRVKGQPGNAPVFYRVPGFYPSNLFDTREELINIIGHMRTQAATDEENIAIARAILKDKYGEDLDQIIASTKGSGAVGEEVVYDSPSLKVTHKRVIKELDPCTSL